MKNTLIIIPTYNELENIQLMLDAVLNQNENVHVLIVDDASPDGTSQVVRKNIALYPT